MTFCCFERLVAWDLITEADLDVLGWETRVGGGVLPKTGNSRGRADGECGGGVGNDISLEFIVCAWTVLVEVGNLSPELRAEGHWKCRSRV